MDLYLEYVKNYKSKRKKQRTKFLKLMAYKRGGYSNVYQVYENIIITIY